MKKPTACLIALSLITALFASCGLPGSSTDKKDTRVEETTSQNTISEDTVFNVSTVTPALAAPDPNVEIIPEAYSALVEFCGEFTEKAIDSQNNSENVIISPLSAYIALAMLTEGADGETLTELTDAIGKINAQDIYALISHLSTLENTTFSSANAIWIDNGTVVKDDYLSTLAEYYLAECRETKLSTAESAVNKWISDKTNGLIPNMLSDDALDTAAVALINALYLNTDWAHDFKKHLTSEREFTDSVGNVTMREFMYNGDDSELVVDTEDYIGVVLRYKDRALEYIALMPKDETVTTSDLTESVTEDGGFYEISKLALWKYTSLYLPKYEQEYSMPLVDTLKAMGIEKVFTVGAELSDITADLFVDSVLQSAVIKVNEEGTEAAAATVIDAPKSAAPDALPEPVVIEFDRPFIFAVYDTESGAVLFAGTHNKP